MTVYQIVCLKTGKKYIGQTRLSLQNRWREHCHAAQQGSPFSIHSAIRKYGKESFEISVLDTARSQYELDAFEILHILAEHTKLPHGYNMTDGGDRTPDRTGSKHTEEWKAAMSKRSKEIERTPEWRAKISASRKGQKQSPEHRKKNSESHRKYPPGQAPSKLKKYWATPERRERDRIRNRTPERRSYTREYNRMYQEAKKLGLTVEQYRLTREIAA
jgi:group I intron endonuclease